MIAKRTTLKSGGFAASIRGLRNFTNHPYPSLERRGLLALTEITWFQFFSEIETTAARSLEGVNELELAVFPSFPRRGKGWL